MNRQTRIAVIAAILLPLGPACARRVNPASAGLDCDAKTGICFPRDGAVGSPETGDVGAANPESGDSGLTGADAGDASVGTILITSPATSPVYTNGTVAVQVSFGPGATVPAQVELLNDGAHLATLSQPFSYSWDTTTQAEGAHLLTAQADMAGELTSSGPLTVVVDRTPPSVLLGTRVPSPSATEVDLSDPIEVSFSEPILPASASTAVKLSQASGSIAATSTISTDGKKVTVTIGDRSTVTLSTAAPVTLMATVAATVTDLAGNAIANPAQWSWTVPLWLNFGSIAGESTSLALDSAGTPFLSAVFEPGAIGSHVYNLRIARHLQGASWDTAFGSPQSPDSLVLNAVTSIDLDTAGTPIVAWSEQPSAGPPSSIHVARWGGTAWDTSYSQLDQVSGGQSNGFNPWLTIDPQNRLFAAWAETGTNNVTDVYVSRWSGSTWTSLGGLGVISANSPVLTIGSDGQPVVGWIGSLGTSGVSKWSGTAWTTTNYAASYSSSLVLDSAQRAVVAYVSGNSIRVSFVDGSGTEYAPAIPTGDTPQNPRIAMGTSDRAFVVWTESGTPARNVRVARWTGSEWDVGFGSLSANLGATDAANPTIALDSKGMPIVAWQEPDTRNTTYVRKSNR